MATDPSEDDLLRDACREVEAVVDIGNTLVKLGFVLARGRAQLRLDLDNACWTGGGEHLRERFARTCLVINAALVELQQWVVELDADR